MNVLTVTYRFYTLTSMQRITDCCVPLVSAHRQLSDNLDTLCAYFMYNMSSSLII